MSKKRQHKGPTIKREPCPECKTDGFKGHVRCKNCGGKGWIFTVSKPENPQQGTLP
jgi:uncharacterized Zn finger protein (UPF0148 family)